MQDIFIINSVIMLCPLKGFYLFNFFDALCLIHHNFYSKLDVRISYISIVHLSICYALIEFHSYIYIFVKEDRF